MAIKLFSVLVLCLLTAGVYAAQFDDAPSSNKNYDNKALRPALDSFSVDPAVSPTLEL